jgi:YidC/Oxa1 family membrane protein insertase
MISSLFHALVYDPLYNGLVFLVDIIPGHDMGLAVIALTILVRIIIYPLSQRAIKTQMAMKKIAPDVEKLKEKHKDNREEQSRAIFALYRERDVHPFASFGLILIQFPILIALYWVFYGGGFPEIDLSLLYSFIPVPTDINMHFLGLIDMAAPSIIIAILAGVTQLVYTRLSMGPRQATAATQTPVEATFSSEMAKSFDIQMRYVLPITIGVVGYFVASAATLYWATSNLFMIGQEYLAGRRFKG